MSDVAALPQISTPSRPTAPTSEAMTACLDQHAQYAEMAVAWGTAVERFEPVEALDEKAIKAHRKVLEDPRSLQVLQILWAESDHVDICDLEAAELAKKFAPNTLTCHALAVALSSKPSDVPGRVKQIQRVVRAARVFGLIDTRPITTKKHLIVATDYLHRTMFRLTRPPLDSDIAQPDFGSPELSA